MKAKLRLAPEERYQLKRGHWYWHDSCWYRRNANGYDGYGCNNGKCIPECRFYPEYGRIEDEEEVIEEHKELDDYKKRRAIENIDIDKKAFFEFLKNFYCYYRYTIHDVIYLS